MCKNSSSNVLKTGDMAFTPWNRLIDEADVKIHNIQIQMLHAAKCLEVQIDSRLI